MTYASGAGRRTFARSSKLNFAPEGDWSEPEKAPRDLKKLFLVAGLGILSWVATYVGMLELIQANMGELPLVHKLIIGFSVAMLMTMIIWLLDQLFAPINLFTKACYVAGYLFLSIISVGFGFGFYWKVLESRSESARSAESAVTQVQGALYAASTRLGQLQATLVQLAQVSQEKAEMERTKGTSCPNSKPGDGPRRKMREDDAQRFGFASEFVKGRVGAVKGEMGALDGDLAKLVSDDKSIIDARTGTRNEFMKALSRKLDMTVTGFNAFRTDPQLKQLRTDLADRAERSTFGDPKKGGFVCPDAQLQQALRGAVKAIDQLPELEKPKIAAVEGSEATIEAFRRLTTTFYGLMAFKLPPSPDELRELQKKAVQSVEGGASAQRDLDMENAGLSKRDYVPLGVALFVDLCLLLVSMGRPMNRLNGLIPKMREAERGPVNQILSRFNDIHRDAQVRQSFEVFRHVVFDFHGDYYVAVPLDAPTPGARLRADADVEHEAHLLANLFTSFEKERIFKRVYSPFLSTRAIQKRLARQGSKFATCAAFRVYRFRDGAWSEIILGAVMGAARRAEAERARVRLEEELLRPAAPAMPAASASGPFASPRHVAEPALRMPERPVAPPPVIASAPAVATEASLAALRAAAQAPVSEGQRPADPVLDAAFGPYARHIRPGAAASAAASAEAARASAAPANSNMAPAARVAETAPRVMLDAMAGRGTAAARPEFVPDTSVIVTTQQPTAGVNFGSTSDSGSGGIDVVLSERRATFTIPVSEARLPEALAGRLGELMSAESGRDTRKFAVPAAEAVEQAAPLALADLTDDGLDVEVEEISAEALDDDAATIAGRLRPQLRSA